MDIKKRILEIVPEAEFSDYGDGKAIVPASSFYSLAKRLKEDEDTSFDYLLSLTGMDFGDSLGVIYHLESTKYGHICVLQTSTNNRENPELFSVCDIWKTANFNEREVYDFFGIRFINHPDMRRLFLRDDWVGYPFRKDYDLESNQLNMTNEVTEDIQIISTQCYGNNGSGIDLMGTTGTIQRVTVTDSTMRDNLGTGIRLVKATGLTFRNDTVLNNNFGIEIPRDVNNVTFSNMNISNNKTRGISMVTSKQTVGTEKIIFENSLISNNSQIEAGKYDGIRIDNYDSTGYIKGVEFRNTQFIDTQMSHTQRYGLTVGSSATISGLILYADCTFSGNVSGNLIASSSVLQRI